MMPAFNPIFIINYLGVKYNFFCKPAVVVVVVVAGLSSCYPLFLSCSF